MERERRPTERGPAGGGERRPPIVGGQPPTRGSATRRDVLIIAAWIVGSIVVITLAARFTAGDGDTPLSYSELVTAVEAGRVREVTIDDGGQVVGTRQDGSTFRSQLPTATGDTGLLQRLEAAGVDVHAERAGTSWTSVLGGLLPFVLLLGAMWWLLGGRGRLGGAGPAAGFARSKAKVIDAQRPATTFDDVAGYEGVKAELSEVVDYLRNPQRYHDAGAVGPGGVLMVGPPGTGKTHLARAVAGQSDVPFFTATASSFIELYVGVGAARVRDLFAQAREKAPAIVFIDEIDAIGGRRGSGRSGTNDEREQTLDQLLAEMDGFDPATGVVVLAATNRPDTLDPALLRPGRFDRRVVVPLPNQTERAEILAVHVRRKKLDGDVDLHREARATAGFSGADLANLANEAAIVAVRDARVVVRAADFEAARERIVIGRRDRGSVLLPDEKRLVATHEAGHAMVAALSAHADPVAKISILPTGVALGVTQLLPLDERHVSTEDELLAALAVRLGGRAAEAVVAGVRSSGPADDIASATALAVRMVRELGLSDAFGPVSYPEDGTADPFAGPHGRPACSEATRQTIDAEVARLVREAEQAATALLLEHRRQLDTLIDRLVEDEVVDGTVVYELLGAPFPADLPAEAADVPVRTELDGAPLVLP